MLRTPRLITQQLALVAVLKVSVLVGLCQAQIPWTHDYNAAQTASTASGAVMLLHFYSDNCVPCKMLDTRAFQDPDLIDAIKQTVIPVKINADIYPEIAKKYSVNRWPTDVYIAADGSELARTISPQKAGDYIAMLERVALRNRDHNVVAQAEGTPAKGLAIHSDPPNKLAGHSKAENHFATGKLSDKDPYATPAATYKPSSPLATALGSSAIKATLVSSTQLDSIAKPSVSSPAKESRPSLPASPTSSGTQAEAAHEAVVENLYCVAVPEKTDSNWESRSLSDEGKSTNQVASGEPLGSSSQLNPFASQAPITPVSALKMGSTAQNLQLEVQKATAPEGGPAMRGYCPVTLDDKGIWKPGDARLAVRHRGRIYYLASRECQQIFLQSPDRYAPILSGFDLVHFLHTGELRDGLREYGCWFKGRVYLFATAENRDFFDEHVIEFAAAAEALQNRGETGSKETSNPGVTPQETLDPSQGRIATEPNLPTLAR